MYQASWNLWALGAAHPRPALRQCHMCPAGSVLAARGPRPASFFTADPASPKLCSMQTTEGTPGDHPRSPPLQQEHRPRARRTLGRVGSASPAAELDGLVKPPVVHGLLHFLRLREAESTGCRAAGPLGHSHSPPRAPAGEIQPPCPSPSSAGPSAGGQDQPWELPRCPAGPPGPAPLLPCRGSPGLRPREHSPSQTHGHGQHVLEQGPAGTAGPLGTASGHQALPALWPPCPAGPPAPRAGPTSTLTPQPLAPTPSWGPLQPQHCPPTLLVPVPPILNHTHAPPCF